MVDVRELASANAMELRIKLYSELEEMVLAALAAGCPISKIKLGEEEIVYRENNNMSLKIQLYFEDSEQ